MRCYSQENLAPRGVDDSNMLNEDGPEERNAMSQHCDANSQLNEDSHEKEDGETESEHESEHEFDDMVHLLQVQPITMDLFKNYLVWTTSNQVRLPPPVQPDRVPSFGQGKTGFLSELTRPEDALLPNPEVETEAKTEPHQNSSEALTEHTS